MNQKKIKSQPLLRGLIHQAMFFIAIGACAPLIIKSSSAVGYVIPIKSVIEGAKAKHHQYSS